MRNGRVFWILASLLAAAALPVQAAPVADLYTATVAAADESDGERAQALRRAMSEVIGRVAGDPQAQRLAGAEQVLSRASELVQQFGYRGRESDNLVLRAIFDGPTLERAMRDAGLPVWGRERPQVLIWLAFGDRLLSVDGPAEARAAVRGVARARGIPLRLPRADEASSGRITAADLRSGNDRRIAAVSRGYDTGVILIGDAARSGDGWAADWRLLDDRGERTSSWRAEAASQAALAANAAARTADILASRFAVTGGGEAQTVSVAVSGVRGASGYTRVSRFLANLTAVNAFSPMVFDGDSVLFQVRSVGGAQALERSIGTADWLVRDDAARSIAGLHAGSEPTLGYRIGRIR